MYYIFYFPILLKYFPKLCRPNTYQHCRDNWCTTWSQWTFKPKST